MAGRKMRVRVTHPARQQSTVEAFLAAGRPFLVRPRSTGYTFFQAGSLCP